MLSKKRFGIHLFVLAVTVLAAVANGTDQALSDHFFRLCYGARDTSISWMSFIPPWPWLIALGVQLAVLKKSSLFLDCWRAFLVLIVVLVLLLTIDDLSALPYPNDYCGPDALGDPALFLALCFFLLASPVIAGIAALAIWGWRRLIGYEPDA